MAPYLRRQYRGGGESTGVIKALVLLLTLGQLDNLHQSNAHFIHIDHNEFRTSGFPRPFPPPPPPPIEQLPQQVPARELSPVELMVDLSNALTYRILHYHSILNRNNFAFSPTALMSVLVALYEGSTGRSAMELRNVLQLPNNRDVVRVGYRDIHRRLRTYFFGSDNPLKGLSLNKENVTITRDYETILMFYGYDLGMDMISSTMLPTTTAPPTTTEISDTTRITTSDVPATTIVPEIKTTLGIATEIETTTLPTIITATDMPTTTTATATAATTTTTIIATTTEAATTTIATTTEQASTSQETTTTTTTTTPEDSTTMEEETTTETPEAKLLTPTTDTENEETELVSPSTGEASLAAPFQRFQKARTLHALSGKLQAPPVSLRPTVFPKLSYLPQPLRNETLTGRYTRRHKRHLIDIKELDAGLFVTLFNTPPQTHHNLFSISEPASGPSLSHVPNEFEVEAIEPHFLHTSNVKQNYGYNTDIISHVFYLANQHLVHTTFKVYNAVLYFKYFDHLKMSVLELELDTPEYNLMILLPDYQLDLASAAASLRLGPPLQVMRKQLKPTWVQAIIPDFKLHGLMFLTNDLQNMGICDIFEPNRADFRPMTDEKGIYVKHIEQSINVNIRTRAINQLKRNYGTQTQPIQISVNHPFLFFIIDRDLDVAVMAGRIINPLNVRIQ